MVESLIGKNVEKADKEHFRYVVSVGIKNLRSELRLSQTCTGVAITSKHVLTTSHCIEHTKPEDVEILAGSIDIRELTDKKDRYDVLRWTTYEMWAKKRGDTPRFEENDVVIIEVKRSFDKRKVVPAKLLFKQNKAFYKHTVTVAGWGETGPSVDKYYKPNTLRQVKIKVLSNKKAVKKIRALSRDPEEYGSNFIFCRATPFVLTGSGDSGGPVITEQNHVVAMIRGIIPNYNKYYECQLNGLINLHHYQCFIQSFTENIENCPSNQIDTMQVH
ncbi:hypothetical protein QAD02_008925 [Eretmocerus hayati]|uniref:Uncharacterized protein n=1 Tax=Eretmocerus hayati TaxID=131215 RepID=A0ACC2N948_9HYME|nr:hypothetical protein QAD02_008925 [Eretmocerus hayati]